MANEYHAQGSFHAYRTSHFVSTHPHPGSPVEYRSTLRGILLPHCRPADFRYSSTSDRQICGQTHANLPILKLWKNALGMSDIRVSSYARRAALVATISTLPR
jgi:hypothetical protein